MVLEKPRKKGIELAFQYDLAEFEDRLGWASGFGVLANYTKQEFSGGDTFLVATESCCDICFCISSVPQMLLYGRH